MAEIKTSGVPEDQACTTYNCPVEATLDIIGGKWKMIILWYIDEEPRRFGELTRLIPNISERVLARQLKEMTEHRLIRRVEYPEVPPKVEYHITHFGESLRPVINKICEWGEEHMDRIDARAEWISKQ